ncbi:hypothetical protein HKD37_01G000976 [Glycine soja]
MGEVEEVQKQMKADMEAMKEKMATMMEAMMSMKKIMEANAVAVAATRAVAKVNLMPPSDLNQMNHPTSDMPSFPPTQQCRYSANNKPSPYPPPSYPQRPSLNQPQNLSTALPMMNTTFSTNQNTNQEMNFAVKKPVEFTPILVSYADLLPYLLDNSMVAITPAKVHQPPFLRGYDSNATCACHGEAPGRSIEHCRALKRKVQGLIDAGWLKFEENRV